MTLSRAVSLAALLLFGACSSSSDSSFGGTSNPAIERCVAPHLSLGDGHYDAKYPPLGGPAVKGAALAVLVPPSSCEEAVAQIKRERLEEMRAQLEVNLARALAINCMSCVDYTRMLTDTAVSIDVALSDGSSGGDEASEYSTTNTQVVDVDEADFIKNDGGYIYVLADGRLQIIDAWPAAEARVVASQTLEGEPRRMFLHAGRLVIYSSLEPISTHASGAYEDCTYGYQCDFTGDGRATQLTVLDVSDPTSPELLRQTRLFGSYVGSRRVDDAVYTLVHYATSRSAPWLRTWPEDVPSQAPSCYADTEPLEPAIILARFQELLAENEAIIEDATFEAFEVGLEDTVYEDGVARAVAQELDDCEDFLVSQDDPTGDTVVLYSVDVTALEPFAYTAIVGTPGPVYASRDNLYLAQRRFADQMSGWFWDDGGHTEATTIHKFRLAHGDSAASYVASGVVKGRVLNQFSMDEHEGHLRVATTTGWPGSPSVHNTVSVLEDGGEGSLELTGQVDNIAPTEDIRSVRFDGDTGYVVTFRQTDPLFVLDLSDPSAPAIRGELKIPGFSTYMHILDEGHLLTIGYETNAAGNMFTGIQLQIFDVTTLSAPELAHKEVIGTRGSTSAAALDHMAFNFFRPRDALALPMVICEGVATNYYADEMTFNGLLVYRVTVDGGFLRLGEIPHETSSQGACSWGWLEADSLVQRSVFMDDFVYSVAPDLIKVSHLDDLAHPVASVPLTD